MMNYAQSHAGLPFGGYVHDFGDEPAEQRQYQQYYRDAMSSNLSEHANNPYAAAGMHQHIPCDIKPRLTKEQHDILESEYTKQPKPNTSTKKGFALSLNVSLDKVNNWFQNRRAKSKQDAKKQQGAMEALNSQQTSYQFNNVSGSDSDTSPAFSSPDYFNMMQHCAPDDQTNDQAGPPQFQQFQEQGQLPMGMPNTFESDDQYQAFSVPPGHGDIFDSPQDLNRRTLTQEQFDAFASQNGMQHTSEYFNVFNLDPHTFGGMLTGYGGPDVKTQPSFVFPSPIGAPIPSHDESLPSTTSERSTMSFPSSSAMQAPNQQSSAGSDWTGSRSSSVSTRSCDQNFPPSIHAPQPQSSANNGPWRPGQSVPVDFNQLSQEFRQAAQGRQMPQQYQQEQPLAWPTDEAYNQRAESQANTITQSMSNVGIHTPQPPQGAAFKSPTPSSSLAARRQRARPAALGSASLRSQSYSGAMQPGSPGNLQQPGYHNVSPGQPLRRVKSSAVINGVTGGRIQKSNVGVAQRSPLNFTFSEAMNSPKVLRHVSSQTGSLVPPTPMSPGQQARAEQARQMQQWQQSNGHASRQASISESDFEQPVDYMSAGSMQPQSFSSPPHTPLYPPQPQFAQQRIGNHVITENTPPQSAPASQQFFPNGAFMPQHQQQPQSQQQQQPVHQPPPSQSQVPPSQLAMQHMFSVQPQQMAPPPQTQAQIPAMTAPSNPHFMITTSGPMEAPMHFPPGGVPIVDANGQIQMAVPQQQYQFMHHPMSQPPLQQAPPHPQQVNMQTPPQIQYPYVTSKSSSPNIQVTAQPPKPAPQPAAELFVHEYHPPEDVKRAATPRKAPVDAGPKNYTFANQTPEHFAKSKKGDKAASSSPASSANASS